MASMRAGKLDKLVYIQARTGGRTPLGDSTVGDWDNPGTLAYAGRVTKSVLQRYTGAQEVHEAVEIFELRRWPFGDPGQYEPENHRIMWRGRPYVIHGVVEKDRGGGVFVWSNARQESTAESAP